MTRRQSQRRASGFWTGRGMFFRAAAIILGVLPLFVCEIALRLAKWRLPAEFAEASVGFDHSHPLFALNASGTRYETAKSKLEFFAHDAFDANKSDREYRVFVLGGSTVQGRPFSIETSFCRWLELSLRAADPSRSFRVVNCGGVSYASYRLNAIVSEVLQYEPDLIILYTGHNEFLEDWTHEKVRSTPTIIARAHTIASNLKTYRLGRKLWLRAIGKNETYDQGSIPVEVEARLDEHGGLSEYHRDNRWRQAVANNFRWNLHSMLRKTTAAGIPTLIANPVCQLRSCLPLKVEDDAQLAENKQSLVQTLLDESKELATFDIENAIDRLAEATEIDPGHAGVWYELARNLDELNRFDEAKTAFVRAKDCDVCPLRITSPLRDVIQEVSREFSVDLVDVQQAFESRSRGQIVDEQLMVDHVHPTIDGHKLIAELFFEKLVKQNVVKQTPGWISRRDELFRQQLDALNYAYYERGRQRLEGLRLWTQGRAKKKSD